jgi:hypothetical protein
MHFCFAGGLEFYWMIMIEALAGASDSKFLRTDNIPPQLSVEIALKSETLDENWRLYIAG